jgi:hypothetical protein
VDILNHQAVIVPQNFSARGFAAQDAAAPRVEAAGFTTEDILWSIGIWSVILTMSPVIVFYMLMVA